MQILIVEYEKKIGHLLRRAFLEESYAVDIASCGEEALYKWGINAYIFDRFYRMDSARSETKGYGLGLAIAKTIILKHNGKIEISPIEKKGTMISVLLPLI